MDMQSKRAGGKFAKGLLFGALAGGVAALLMAPRSGKKTREMLRERGIEMGNNVRRKFKK